MSERPRTGLDMLRDALAALAVAPSELLSLTVNGRSVADLAVEVRQYLGAVDGREPIRRSEVSL